MTSYVIRFTKQKYLCVTNKPAYHCKITDTFAIFIGLGARGIWKGQIKGVWMCDWECL